MGVEKVIRFIDLYSGPANKRGETNALVNMSVYRALYKPRLNLLL